MACWCRACVYRRVSLLFFLQRAIADLVLSGVQLLAAIPALEQTTIKIKIRSNHSHGKFRPDTKLPAQGPARMTAGTSNVVGLESAEERVAESEVPRQHVQDLV